MCMCTYFKQRGDHERERGYYTCFHHHMRFVNYFYSLVVRILTSCRLVSVLVSPEMPGLSSDLGLDARGMG